MALGLPQPPFAAIGAGLQTVFGTHIPPGSQAFFVRSTGPGSQDPPEIAARMLKTLAAGLAQCRANKNDFVFVMPGHSENVTTGDLANLVAGTRIIGVGDLNRSDAPTFRWTATTSTWPISVADVEVRGLYLRLEGADGVVKAINITGAGCRLVGNRIQVASGAALKATIACEIGSAATDCYIGYNYVTGTATHNVTDGFKVVGGTVPSGLVIEENTMIASATAGNGLINITVAALNIAILNNRIYNTHTASTACIAFADVASDGIVMGNLLGTKANGTASAQGIVFAGTNPLVVCAENYSVDEKQKSGALAPPVVAT